MSDLYLAVMVLAVCGGVAGLLLAFGAALDRLERVVSRANQTGVETGTRAVMGVTLETERLVKDLPEGLAERYDPFAQMQKELLEVSDEEKNSATPWEHDPLNLFEGEGPLP
jgi:hypothetical protein